MSSDKTEDATETKKNEARKKGQFARSKDLASAVELLGAILVLKYYGKYVADDVCGFLIKIYTDDFPNTPVPDRKEIIPYALDWFLGLGRMLVPFLILMCVLAIVANWYQVGLNFSTSPLKLDLNKLNPVNGIKRLFSIRNVVMLVMNLAKLALILSVAWSSSVTELTNVLVMIDMETAGTFIYSTDRVLALAQKLAIVLLVLGFADFQYQKYKHAESLKMTKQEVKEEFKQQEGDPKIKGERRKRAMQLAQQRMMGEVPQAEVVVRNPTHFAVAIAYKPGMPAPMVVAKGKDKLAEKIIEVAREAGVPLVENPPLARELYKKVEIDQPIPEELFKTVAELLTSVMSEDKKRRMMREFNEDAA